MSKKPLPPKFPLPKGQALFFDHVTGQVKIGKDAPKPKPHPKKSSA